MTSALLVALLIAHGLVHLAIWLPHPLADAENPPPFRPDHSALLTTSPVTQAVTHRLSVVLATGAATGYVVAGVAVATSVPGATTMVAAAAGLGLAVKALLFYPLLTLGVLINAALLVAAVSGWPVSLT